MKLYIIRHGQTEWNVERRMQGWQDSPLTELGVQAAQALGEYLVETPIDRIYCSTSGRASRTAELIRGDRSIEMQHRDDLRELCMGDWEGVKIDEIEQVDTLRHDEFRNNPHHFGGGTGESFHDILNRTRLFLQDMIKEHGDTDHQIMVVSHTVTIKAMMLNMLEKGVEAIWETPHIHPVSLTIAQYGGPSKAEGTQGKKKFALEAVAITPHL